MQGALREHATGSPRGEEAPPRQGPSRVEISVVAACFVVAFAIASIWLSLDLGKSLWFDTYNYEYWSGWAFFHGFGSALALPGKLQTYLDPQQNSLYYLLISHTSPKTMAVVISGLESLALSTLSFVVYLVARRTRWSMLPAVCFGVAAGVTGFLSPIYRSELGGTMGDTITVVGLVVAASLLFIALSARSVTARLRCSLAAGALLGFCVVAKVTMLMPAVALVVGFGAALLVGRHQLALAKERFVSFVVVAVTSFVVAAAVYAPLGLTVYDRYQNPFFPYYNGLARSPQQQPSNFQDYRYTVNSLSDWVHHLASLVVGTHSLESGTLLQRSPLIIVGALAICALLIEDLLRRRSAPLLFLEISVPFGVLAWSGTVVIYRYAAPIEMAMGAVLVILVLRRDDLPRVVAPLVAAASLVLALLGGGGAQTIRTAFGASYFTSSPAALTGGLGTHVMLLSSVPDSYLVPSMRPGTDIVRVGGKLNLELVMSDRWWSQVRAEVLETPQQWQVIEGLHTQADSDQTLRRLGIEGVVHGCKPFSPAPFPTELCQLSIS